MRAALKQLSLPLNKLPYSNLISGSSDAISGSAGNRMTGSDMGNSTGNAQFLQVPQASTSETPRLTPQHEPVQSPQPSSRRSSKVCKPTSRVVQIMYCPLKLKNLWQPQFFLIISIIKKQKNETFHPLSFGLSASKF